MEKEGHKKRFIYALTFVIILIFILIIIDKITTDSKGEIPIDLVCSIDSDCVPSNCCHSSSCINLEEKPNCEGVYCTQICEPGTLDCGQGNCKCMEGKCQAIIG